MEIQDKVIQQINQKRYTITEYLHIFNPWFSLHTKWSVAATLVSLWMTLTNDMYIMGPLSLTNRD